MIKLDEDTRARLRQIQRREKDRRRLIKITVVLMLDGGFTAEQIEQIAFGIDASTVYRCTTMPKSISDRRSSAITSRTSMSSTLASSPPNRSIC